MGKQARLRSYAKRMNMEQPMRLVPSRRGLATVFGLCAVLGFGAGALSGFMTVRSVHAAHAGARP